VIDEHVATAETDRYPWKGTRGTSRAVEIVDTPGVRTGDLCHDEIAETAVRDADLLLFVISPSFFNDTLASYFRHVALELAKLEPMIVVVNKSTLMASTETIREDEVRKALGPEHQLSHHGVVRCRSAPGS
jgi:predicted GTPase